MLTNALRFPPSPLWRLQRSLAQPGDAQRDLLLRLVRRASNTVWGRAHGFAELQRSGRIIEDYQQHVPLSEFVNLQAYIDRVVTGEPDVIWPGRPTAFVVSGGTRSGGRLIPLSREAMMFLVRSSLLPGLSYLATKRDASAILRGKILSLPGGIETGDKAGGKPIGEVSGLLAHRAPRILAYWLQALPRRVMLMDNWDAKLSEASRLAIRQDVRSIIMVPSWAPVFLERVRLVVGAGSVAEAVERVWPNLRVFFGGGVALSSYRSILSSYLGPHVDLIESYSASEGLFAFQDCSSEEGLIVNLEGGVFFEFAPVVDGHPDTMTRHTIETAEPGVDYAMFVTNASGLWSVCVEDIVRFVSTLPPRLVVIGRTREMLDRYGDATTAEHARRVLAAADEAGGTQCWGFHLTYADSEESPTPRHHWVLEFDAKPTDLVLYARMLDESMMQLNGRYRTRRLPGAMAPPLVTAVPAGATAEYLRRTRARFGGQSKVLTVSENSDIGRGIVAAALDIDPSRIEIVSLDTNVTSNHLPN